MRETHTSLVEYFVGRAEVDADAAEELGLESYAIPLEPIVDRRRGQRALAREGMTPSAGPLPTSTASSSSSAISFTADIARLSTNSHTIIELNDGGCSNFPDQLDPRAVFATAKAICEMPPIFNASIRRITRSYVRTDRRE